MRPAPRTVAAAGPAARAAFALRLAPPVPAPFANSVRFAPCPPAPRPPQFGARPQGFRTGTFVWRLAAGLRPSPRRSRLSAAPRSAPRIVAAACPVAHPAFALRLAPPVPAPFAFALLFASPSPCSPAPFARSVRFAPCPPASRPPQFWARPGAPPQGQKGLKKICRYAILYCRKRYSAPKGREKTTER